MDRVALLNASPDDYWMPIEAEINAAGSQGRHALLLNHQAAHLLAWANIARNQALAARRSEHHQEHDITQWQQGYNRAVSVIDQKPDHYSLQAWLNADGNTPLPSDTDAFKAGYQHRANERSCEWLKKTVCACPGPAYCPHGDKI